MRRILYPFAAALLAAGCHVVIATDGDDALAQLAAHLRTPDLILTDFQLGTAGDGLDVIRRLRAQPSHQRRGVAIIDMHIRRHHHECRCVAVALRQTRARAAQRQQRERRQQQPAARSDRAQQAQREPQRGVEQLPVRGQIDQPCERGRRWRQQAMEERQEQAQAAGRQPPACAGGEALEAGWTLSSRVDVRIPLLRSVDCRPGPVRDR